MTSIDPSPHPYRKQSWILILSVLNIQIPKGDIQTLNNDTFHSFFLNQTQVNGYKGFVGYGVRELNANETNAYCKSQTLPSLQQPPLVTEQVNFTSDYSVRTYTMGCYFYDAETGKWSSRGMHLQDDTNIQASHCSSLHLTWFAGGLLVADTDINYNVKFKIICFKTNLRLNSSFHSFFFKFFAYSKTWPIICNSISIISMCLPTRRPAKHLSCMRLSFCLSFCMSPSPRGPPSWIGETLAS